MGNNNGQGLPMDVAELLPRNFKGNSMKNELAIKEIRTVLTSSKPEYLEMVKNIDQKLPAVEKASTNFFKTSSQFKNVTLDVTAITPIRSIKHTLAEIEKVKNAIKSSIIGNKKENVKLKRKEKSLKEASDELERESLAIKILEIQDGIASARNYVEGAIRKMNFFVNQYNALLEHIGVKEVTEEMYEREENRYHIMTAMKQALSAARTKGGLIDEGNHIYLFDLGINGASAQREVFNYLKMENELINNGSEPTHEMSMRWLETCANKFENAPKTFAERRGFKVLDKQSLTNREEQK